MSEKIAFDATQHIGIEGFITQIDDEQKAIAQEYLDNEPDVQRHPLGGKVALLSRCLVDKFGTRIFPTPQLAAVLFDRNPEVVAGLGAQAEALNGALTLPKPQKQPKGKKAEAETEAEPEPAEEAETEAEAPAEAAETQQRYGRNRKKAS